MRARVGTSFLLLPFELLAGLSLVLALSACSGSPRSLSSDAGSHDAGAPDGGDGGSPDGGGGGRDGGDPFPSFHGIIQFTGEGDAGMPENPYIAGGSLNYFWAAIEPQQGQFDWSSVDSDVSRWATAGKKVVIRISTSGNCYSNQPGSCDRTPEWLYDAGVPSLTDPGGAKHPQFWNSLWQSAFASFVQQFAARYDGHPSVAYIDAAVGNDGETIVDKVTDWGGSAAACSAWQALGYSDAVWWTTIEQILSTYQTYFRQTAVAVQPDMTFICNTPGYDEARVLNYVAAQHSLWLQNDSLGPGQALTGPWQQVPLAVEQGSPANDAGVFADEMDAGLQEGAGYILVFTSDLRDPENQPTLQAVSALASP